MLGADGSMSKDPPAIREVELSPTRKPSSTPPSKSCWHGWVKGLSGLAAILACGVIVGLAAPGGNDDPAPWNHISVIVGWCYFFAWSVSFYPQVYLNWKRKSVVGLSFDFEAYNIIGFLCYSVFNCAFYWSASIQEDYRQANDGHSNVVRLNDVVFAVHAVVITLITIVQIFIYERGDQVVSRTCKALCALLVGIPVVYLIPIWAGASGDFWTWLNFMYCLSYVKLAVTLIKYIPQVYLNVQRKSTIGWNIWNVLLDFTGGSLSIVQLFIDAGTTHDWSAVTGDPVKFGLGFCSMFFDVIFMIQHYWLYSDSNDEDEEQRTRHSLLGGARDNLTERQRRASWGEATV